MADEVATDRRRGAGWASLQWRDLARPFARGARIAALESRLAAQADTIARQEAALAHHQKIIDRSSAQARIGVWECDLADDSLAWTNGTYDLFGLPHGSPITREQILALYEPASAADLASARSRAIATRSSFDLDIQIRTPCGTARWLRITANVECEGEVPVRLFGMKQDVTEQKALTARLRHLAECDPLTDLANRARLDAVLGEAVRRGAGALLLVDLDGFKQINDTHGHAAGDECLRQVADRLRRVFGEVACVARIGGDEFAVVFAAQISREVIEIRVGLFLVALTFPMRWDGRTMQVGASIGVAPFDARTGCDASTIYVEADLALYAAKASGKRAYRFYSDDLRPGTAQDVSTRRLADEASFLARMVA